MGIKVVHNEAACDVLEKVNGWVKEYKVISPSEIFFLLGGLKDAADYHKPEPERREAFVEAAAACLYAVNALDITMDKDSDESLKKGRTGMFL